MRPFLQRHHSYITLFAAVIAIAAAAIETDVFIPSFPDMQSYFQVTEAEIQLLVSINFLGLCVSGLFFGPLSDSYGRKNLLVTGISLFAIASIGASLTSTFHHLLFWRFLQGLGSASCFVIPGAIIFDLFSQEKAADIMGGFNSLISIIMAAAPMLGSWLAIHYDWRANFIAIASVAFLAWLIVVFGVAESLDSQNRKPFNFSNICYGFRQVLFDHLCLANLAIFCAIISGYLVYVSNLSLIFIDRLHVPQDSFPWYQAAVVASFALVSVSSGRLFKIFGSQSVKYCGITLHAVGALSLFFVANVAATDPILITVSMCLFSMGAAMMMNLIYGDFMSRYPDIKGISSALASSMRLLTNVAFISLSGLLYTGSILPVASLVLLLTTISVLSLLYIAAYGEASR